MYILRLFDGDILSQPIDARLLRDGQIGIGRDPSADWVMHDPECRISRWHCVLSTGPDTLTVKSLGANGVFDDVNGERFEREVETPIQIPSTLRFGNFRLVVDHAAQTGAGDGREGQTLILTPPLGASIDVPADYADESTGAAAKPDGSLLDRFCEGAGLEPSAFAMEDPEDIMRRAGALYRQMVLGVGDLMAERERMRSQYEIARTTIGGANNNPFKWAPTQRLALDLLLAEGRGFMNGPTALKASFVDIKKHLVSTFRGLHASLRTSIAIFDPAEVERAVPSRGSLLQSRSTQLWNEVTRRHAMLQDEVAQGGDGSLNQAFVAAYDAATSERDGNAS
jgi:predicted component of type VI protein secretion system